MAFHCASALVLAMTCVQIEVCAQGREAAKPPAVLNTVGAFTVVEVSREPVIDGRDWIASDVHATFEAGAVPVATQEFSLTATNCGDHSGDFERCEVLFQRGPALAVRIDRGFTGWVYVTPDARYIFTEPLYVLDVRGWTQYALFDAMGIQNYVSIDAISGDHRRLLISRRDCALDCRDEPRRQYYELTLPK